ncbi:MAG: hypothetical protein DHS20C17_03940 [Cyclobacteriaceae bacterium]|nr:MAG: hypothetical protein DHS20C17_03940 [Cyclobacteriaceae bacterium]
MKFGFPILLVLFISCVDGKDTYQAGISAVNLADAQTQKQATFAGGCFWCTEAVFERVIGVQDVISGYTGGSQKNPTYKQVSYGKTDHAEAVQINFDPNQITYAELVEIFFATHDPTTLNRQGPDIGKQYRSAVYYHDEQQKEITEAYISKLTSDQVYADPIVTEVQQYSIFYPAEDYHQDYYQKHPNHPYIVAIAKPKVEKFKKRFKDKLKTSS